MAKVYHPATALEAVTLRREMRESSVYLAGGTEVLRLASPAEGKALIDVLPLLPSEITEDGGKVRIGAGCSLQQLADSPLLPDFIREAASFCASSVRRGSATLGGNLGARRDDGYLAAALTAAEAVSISVTPHGISELAVGDYLRSDCVRLLQYVVIDAGRQGSVKRVGNTAASHAAVIAAESEGVYAVTVRGSGLIYSVQDPAAPAPCGCKPEETSLRLSGEEFFGYLDAMEYKDDVTGSGAYKKYLVKTFYGR